MLRIEKKKSASYPATLFEFNPQEQVFVTCVGHLKRFHPSQHITKDASSGKYGFVIESDESSLVFSFDYTGFTRHEDGNEYIRAECTNRGFEGVKAVIHMSTGLMQ